MAGDCCEGALACLSVLGLARSRRRRDEERAAKERGAAAARAAGADGGERGGGGAAGADAACDADALDATLARATSSMRVPTRARDELEEALLHVAHIRTHGSADRGAFGH